jgi:hypothetical protein
MVLYSNDFYLNKYNKEIPKTWDQLIETAQYIMEQERIENKNSHLYGYNGLFSDIKEGTISSINSIRQFIYSCRDDKNSTVYPYIKSKITKNAFNKIKEIKEKVSMDELFKLSEHQTDTLLNEKNILLFAAFWNSELPNDNGLYNETLLPGLEEGISGSTLLGYNIGISKYIDDDKRNASIEVLKYFIDKEFQKEIIIKKFHKHSAIMDLYKEEEVCSILDCEIVNNLQFPIRPMEVNNYNEFEYQHKYLEHFYEFLYGNKNVDTVVNDIEDITKFYYMDLDKDNIFGIVVFSVINIFVIIVFASFIFSLFPQFKQYYAMFDLPMWINYIGASMFIIYSVLTRFGEPTRFKCHIFILMLLTGYTMLYVPSLSFVIVHYPKWNNKYMEWIKNNEKKFLYISYVIEALFMLLSAINPSFEPVRVYVESSKNYYQCEIDRKNIFGFILLIIEIIFHVALFITIIIFMILEWPIKPLRPFTKSLLNFLTLDGVAFFSLFLLQMISRDNYYIESLCPFTVLLVFIMKHIYLYIISVWFEISTKKKAKEEEMVNDLLKFNNGEGSTNITVNINDKSKIESAIQTNTDTVLSEATRKVSVSAYA